MRWRSDRTADDNSSSTPMPRPATDTMPIATSQDETVEFDLEVPQRPAVRRDFARQPGRGRHPDQPGRHVVQPDGAAPDAADDGGEQHSRGNDQHHETGGDVEGGLAVDLTEEHEGECGRGGQRRCVADRSASSAGRAHPR